MFSLISSMTKVNITECWCEHENLYLCILDWILLAFFWLFLYTYYYIVDSFYSCFIYFYHFKCNHLVKCLLGFCVHRMFKSLAIVCQFLEEERKKKKFPILTFYSFRTPFKFSYFRAEFYCFHFYSVSFVNIILLVTKNQENTNHWDLGIVNACRVFCKWI